MIDTLLKMSVMGSVVIGIVMLLRLFLRRAPKIFSYMLWLIVLFRLLCPMSVALPVSVFNLFPSQQMSVADPFPSQEHLGNSGAIPAESAGISGEGSDTSKEEVVIEDSPVSEHLAESQAAMEVTSLWSWKNITLLIWLIGVCAMVGYAVVGVLQLHKKLQHASLDRENIYLLEGIPSPFVVGMLRPKIYLPCGLEEKERTYILLHEKTHIRRGDPLFRVLGYIALTLHWFNPFVWVAFFLSGRDMEMSCDEQVLRKLGDQIRCDYSGSLLAMAQGKGAIGFTPLAFGEGDTGKRIKNVLNYKKTTLQVVIVGVLVVVLAAIALGADAVEDTPESGQTQKADDLIEMQNPVPTETQPDEQTDILTMELFYQILERGELTTYDFRNFVNGNMDMFHDDALNYYLTFSFSNELGDFTLSFSYMKEDDSLDAVYLTREWDGEMIGIYNRDPGFGHTEPESSSVINKFLTASFDIMDEISFALPKGLRLEDYRADVGTLGGRLFSPNVNEGGTGTPAEWLACGMVSRYTQANVLEWKDGLISDVHYASNHTMVETQGRINDLDAPAMLASVRHDLYTAAEMGEMDAQGISYEQTCDYWYLFIAKEGETYGYVFSLSQKEFTVDDMMALAKSVRLLEPVQNTSQSKDSASEQDTSKDSAVIATLSVRTISRSARCIDNYVIPDSDWEKDYGSELAFAENCKYCINSSRTTMDAKEVSFSKFADVIDAGDPMMNKPCIVEIHNGDQQIHEITLISERYQYGVSYATVSEGHLYSGAMFGDANGDPMAVYPAFYGSLEPMRTEHMDISTTPGEETIAIYSGVADGGSHGDVFIRDADGNLIYHYAVNDSGGCWQNLYAGRMDGAGEPYLLEVNLENRDTYGEYSFYVYSLGAENGAYTQIVGSRIEWNKTGSLIYEPDEMLMFFHELGHYLYNSHLLVGMENQQIRTEPVCDEDHYTYAKFAPTCFPDPYAGMDVK